MQVLALRDLPLDDEQCQRAESAHAFNRQHSLGEQPQAEGYDAEQEEIAENFGEQLHSLWCVAFGISLLLVGMGSWAAMVSP